MTIILLFGMFFLNISLTEKAIAQSQVSGVTTYYLAEAGINEMIWLIVNDPVYETNFIHNDDWSTSTTRIDPFGLNSGSYTVTANNTSAAHCDIVATGLYDVGNGNYAQRVIKTDIFRAVGTTSSILMDSAGYADGNITITNSYIKFLKGSPHSNNTFDVNNQNVEMIVENDVRATGNYLEHSLASTTIMGWVYADNWATHPRGTGTAPFISMPAVDFNSASPSSYKNMALSFGSYWTGSDFDDEICNKMNGNLTLSKKITYIDGSVDLRGPILLLYPPTGGVLIINGDLIVGSKDYKQCGSKIYGRPDIKFMHVAGKPSGVIVSGKVRFLEYTGMVDIEGIVYSNAEMDILNLDPILSSFYVRGGAIGQKLDIDSCYGWPVIEHDNTILFDTLGPASSSLTIIVEHWEEEY